MPTTTQRPTAPPTLAKRAGTVLRFPFGALTTAFRYTWRVTALHRSEAPGDASDLPPALPEALVDDVVKPLEAGWGPLYHRRFALRIRDADVDAAGLLDRLVCDLDAAAPSEVMTFRKLAGELGRLDVGDEYRVRMPGPWDGPVRVVHRDATSFRFVTLARHLEAGQIEFRAVDDDGGLRFEIEAWSRAGDRLARLLYHRLGIGKEIQLNAWVQFCLSTPRLAGGRRNGGITVDTRRVDEV